MAILIDFQQDCTGCRWWNAVRERRLNFLLQVCCIYFNKYQLVGPDCVLFVLCGQCSHSTHHLQRKWIWCWMRVFGLDAWGDGEGRGEWNFFTFFAFVVILFPQCDWLGHALIAEHAVSKSFSAVGFFDLEGNYLVLKLFILVLLWERVQGGLVRLAGLAFAEGFLFMKLF